MKTEDIVFSPRVQQMARLNYEVSIVLYLTPDGRIVGSRNYDEVGSVESVRLPEISEVIRGCKVNKTNKIVLIHNHPYLNGGYDPSPSAQDLVATRKFKEQLERYNIELVDHVIVCPNGYFSFRYHNLL